MKIAKKAIDFPGEIEFREKEKLKREKLAEIKQKTFNQLTREEKDFLLEELLVRLNLIS